MSQQPRHLAEQNRSTYILEALAVKFPGQYQPLHGKHFDHSRRAQ